MTVAGPEGGTAAHPTHGSVAHNDIVIVPALFGQEHKTVDLVRRFVQFQDASGLPEVVLESGMVQPRLLALLGKQAVGEGWTVVVGRGVTVVAGRGIALAAGADCP